MIRRLRPVLPSRGKPQKEPPRNPEAPPAHPTPAGLQNPYGRYYTAPRSFEQLVERHRNK